jgi:hypothetical protein
MTLLRAPSTCYITTLMRNVYVCIKSHTCTPRPLGDLRPGAARRCGDAQAVDVPMAARRPIIVISDAVGEQVRWASTGTPGRGGARRAG